MQHKNSFKPGGCASQFGAFLTGLACIVWLIVALVVAIHGKDFFVDADERVTECIKAGNLARKTGEMVEREYKKSGTVPTDYELNCGSSKYEVCVGGSSVKLDASGVIRSSEEVWTAPTAPYTVTWNSRDRNVDNDYCTHIWHWWLIGLTYIGPWLAFAAIPWIFYFAWKRWLRSRS